MVGVKAPSAASCTECGGELLLRRVPDLHIVEYRARC